VNSSSFFVLVNNSHDVNKKRKKKEKEKSLSIIQCFFFVNQQKKCKQAEKYIRMIYQKKMGDKKPQMG